MANSTTLKKLELGNNKLGAAGVAFLKEALRKSSRLSELNLGRVAMRVTIFIDSNEIDTTALDDLCNIMHNACLSRISLSIGLGDLYFA